MISAFGIEHGDISKSKKRTAAEVATGAAGAGLLGFGVRDDFNASGLMIEGNKWQAKGSQFPAKVKLAHANGFYQRAGKIRRMGQKKMLAGGALMALGAYSHDKAKRQGRV